MCRCLSFPNAKRLYNPFAEALSMTTATRARPVSDEWQSLSDSIRAFPVLTVDGLLLQNGAMRICDPTAHYTLSIRLYSL